MASGESSLSKRKSDKISARALSSADKNIQKGNYGKAFANYLLVLKLSPNRKHEIKDNFTLAVREWGEQLERSGRVTDLFCCYEQACQQFPDSETMLNNMGAQLFRLGYIDEAASFFRRSLHLDPDYLGARENLENICGHLVERWHFRMLNDRVRNQLYRSAIHAAVRQGYNSVLDIGTGTGLLSMFAVDAGARSVYACDMSKTMYEMACDVLLTNQMAQKVHVIHAKSTDLTIPEHIPHKISLVVTEIFDVALFGEGVLPSLQHAWGNLLKNPGLARVIPAGATLNVCGIECEYIRQHNRFLYPGMQLLDFSGLSFECRTGQPPPASSPSSPYSRTSSGRDYSSGGSGDGGRGKGGGGCWEPYTSEFLDSLPGGARVLLPQTTIANLNFNDPQCIDKLMEGYCQDLVLPVTANGRLDAIACWFDLHLDADLTLTTAPGSGSCWEQALYPVLPSHLQNCESHNLLVRKNDRVELRCAFGSEHLSVRCTAIHKSQRNQNTPRSTSLPNTAAALTAHTDTSQQPPEQGWFPTRTRRVNQPSPVMPASLQYSRTLANANNNLPAAVSIGGPQVASASPWFGPSWLTNGQFPSLGSHPLLLASPRQPLVRPLATSSFLATSNSHRLSNQPNQQLNPHPSSPTSFLLSNPHHSSSSQVTQLRFGDLNMFDYVGCRSHDYHNRYRRTTSSPVFPVHDVTPTRSQLFVPGASAMDDTSSSDDLWFSDSHKEESFTNGFHIQAHALRAHTSPKSTSFNSVSSSPPLHPSLSVSPPLPGIQFRHETDFLENGASNRVQESICNDSLSINNNFNGLHSRPNSHISSQNALFQKPEVFYLERHELWKLNDLNYNRALCNALQYLRTTCACATGSSNGGYRLLAVCGGNVPVVALQSLQLGAGEVCVLGGSEHASLLASMASANHVCARRLSFADAEDLETLEGGFSAMFVELVDEGGCLQQGVLEHVALARATCLETVATVMPGRVTLQAMLIESPALRRESLVTSDDNTLGYLVAAFINDFQMTTHCGIDLSVLEHEPLTQPFELLTFDLNEFTVGEVPSYLEQTNTVYVRATETGTVHAILYWFDFHLTPNVKVSSSDQRFHWKQAAILQKIPVTVSTGSTLKVKGMCRNNCIHANLSLVRD